MTDAVTVEGDKATIHLTDDFQGGTIFIMTLAATVLKEEYGVDRAKELITKIANLAQAEAEKFNAQSVTE